MTQKLADLKQAFVPVPRIDEHFGPSGATAKLEVLRTWPKDSALSSSDSSPCARFTLIDVNRAEANQPIELLAGGAWYPRLCGVEKYDVLIISGCRVERIDVDVASTAAGVNTADPMECEYRMVVDDSTDQAAIIVYNWRDRILARPGKLHTSVSIKDAAALPAPAPEPAVSTSASTKTRRRGAPTADHEADDSARSTKYVYTPLECLQPPMEANVYGVVSILRPPRRSTAGAGDWLLSVGLVDPSLASGGCGSAVMFNVFRPEPAQLPQLQPGDVVRFHRILVAHYQGSKVGGTVRKASQFVAVRPDRAIAQAGGVPDPFFSSAKNYTPLDVPLLSGLLEWSAECQWSAEDASDSSSAVSNLQSGPAYVDVFHRPMSDLRFGEFCDVTVLVLAVLNTDDGNQHVAAWDGTELPSGEQWFTWTERDHLAATERANEWPTFGSVLRVRLPMGSSARVGRWYKLRNVFTARGNQSQAYLRFIHTSKVTEPEPHIVERMERAIAERQAAVGHGAIQPSAITSQQVPQTGAAPPQLTPHLASVGPTAATVALNATQPFTPIKAVLQHPEAHGQFRLRCRLVAALPRDVSLFSHAFCARCQLAAPCPAPGKEERKDDDPMDEDDACAQCGGRDALSHRWGFLALLEDASGLLPAAAWGVQAALLLPGLSPQNLHRSTLTRQALTERLGRLLDGRQWLDCLVAALPSPSAPTSTTAAIAGSPWSASQGFSLTEDSVGLLSLGDDGDSEDERAAAAKKRGATDRQRRYQLVHTALRMAY